MQPIPSLIPIQALPRMNPDPYSNPNPNLVQTATPTSPLKEASLLLINYFCQFQFQVPRNFPRHFRYSQG